MERPEIQIDALIQTLQDIRRMYPDQQINIWAYEGEISGIVAEVGGNELGYIPNGSNSAQFLFNEPNAVRPSTKPEITLGYFGV